MWKVKSWQTHTWHPHSWWGGSGFGGKPFVRHSIIFPKLPEVEFLETIEDQYQGLITQQLLLRAGLKRLGKIQDLREERAKLQKDLRALNGQVKAVRVRLQKQQQQVDLALKRYNEEEEEIERSIILFVVSLLEE